MQMYKKIWKRYRLNSDYLSGGMLDWEDGGVKRNLLFTLFGILQHVLIGIVLA